MRPAAMRIMALLRGEMGVRSSNLAMWKAAREMTEPTACMSPARRPNRTPAMIWWRWKLWFGRRSVTTHAIPVMVMVMPSHEIHVKVSLRKTHAMMAVMGGAVKRRSRPSRGPMRLMHSKYMVSPTPRPRMPLMMKSVMT